MANNKKVNAADPSTGIQSQEFELQYLQDMLGVSREHILAAVAAVGTDRERITTFIRKQGSSDGNS